MIRYISRFTILDGIVLITAITAVVVVGYRQRTQGYFDLKSLLYMALFIAGYVSYRVPKRNRVAPSPSKSVTDARNQADSTTRSKCPDNGAKE